MTGLKWLKTKREHLQKVQESRFRHAGLLDERHGVSEVVDVITVHIQHHGLRKLGRKRRSID